MGACVLERMVGGDSLTPYAAADCFIHGLRHAEAPSASIDYAILLSNPLTTHLPVQSESGQAFAPSVAFE